MERVKLKKWGWPFCLFCQRRVLHWDVNQVGFYSSSLRVWHSWGVYGYVFIEWMREERKGGRKDRKEERKLTKLGVGNASEVEDNSYWSMAGGYREFKKIQDGVEPFFFTKVKKSLTRWELWFLFAVVQVEIKLEGLELFDSIRCPGYTRSSASPPINIHILNAPCFPSHGNKHIRSWIPGAWVPRDACSGIKVILHGILKFPNPASQSQQFFHLTCWGSFCRLAFSLQRAFRFSPNIS